MGQVLIGTKNESSNEIGPNEQISPNKIVLLNSCVCMVLKYICFLNLFWRVAMLIMRSP